MRSKTSKTGYCIPVLITLIAAIIVHQEEAACSGIEQARYDSYSTLTFNVENDVFGKTDRHYTHGWGLTWIWEEFTVEEEPPLFAWPFFSLLSLLGESGIHRNISFSLRQNVYTPENLTTPVLLEDDHPYAGVTLVPIGFHSKSDRSASSLELDIGIVGPHSFAEQTQKKIHELIDDRDPKGWDNQLNDELVVNLNFARHWLLYRRSIHEKLTIEALPHVGCALGNMSTYINTGAQLRLEWPHSDRFGSYLLQIGSSVSERGISRGQLPSFLFHLVTAVDGHVVIRDIFLDGNTFTESHNLDKQILTGNVMIGIGLQVSRFIISYSSVFQSKTFRLQKEPNVFGGLMISFLL